VATGVASWLLLNWSWGPDFAARLIHKKVLQPMNHFGSSLFFYKPSAIITYSAGQWGGMRAAVGMRTFLSELGCLPVSAMIHVPKAQEIFNADGSMLVREDQDACFDYFGRTFNQLTWWAQAAKEYRTQVDPHKLVKDFKTDPFERNVSSCD
jgi:hypothetical protein